MQKVFLPENFSMQSLKLYNMFILLILIACPESIKPNHRKIPSWEGLGVGWFTYSATAYPVLFLPVLSCQFFHWRLMENKG